MANGKQFKTRGKEESTDRMKRMEKSIGSNL